MSEMFQVGVVGCGPHTRESLLPALRTLYPHRVELAAVADLNAAIADQVGAEYGVGAYPDLDSMISAERLDGVIVAVPPSAHAMVVRAALEAGLHVLCEKPLGIDGATATELVTLAARMGRVLGVGYQYAIQAAWPLERVRSGTLGELTLVQAKWIRSEQTSNGGIPEAPSFWSNPEARGAGADLACHLLSLVLPVIGEPLHVTARTWNSPGRALYGDRFAVETAMHLMIDTATSRAVVMVDWSAPTAADDLGVSYHGDLGNLFAPLLAADLPSRTSHPVLYLQDGQSSLGPLPLSTEQCFPAEIVNWAGACRGEDRLTTSPEIAALIQAVLDAAYESARDGGRRLALAARPALISEGVR